MCIIEHKLFQVLFKVRHSTLRRLTIFAFGFSIKKKKECTCTVVGEKVTVAATLFPPAFLFLWMQLLLSGNLGKYASPLSVAFAKGGSCLQLGSGPDDFGWLTSVLWAARISELHLGTRVPFSSVGLCRGKHDRATGNAPGGAGAESRGSSTSG